MISVTITEMIYRAIFATIRPRLGISRPRHLTDHAPPHSFHRRPVYNLHLRAVNLESGPFAGGGECLPRDVSLSDARRFSLDRLRHQNRLLARHRLEHCDDDDDMRDGRVALAARPRNTVRALGIGRGTRVSLLKLTQRD